MGNPREMTVLAFAQKVLDIIPGDTKIIFVHPEDERTADDPKIRQPDISRAEKILGWTPTVPLEQGLVHTAGYFRGRLGL
jgi:nucleoside-diphosphate-sugar epimerase